MPKRKANKNLVAIAKDKTDRYCEIDDVTGAFAAEFTDVIVQKYHTNATDNDSSAVSSPTLATFKLTLTLV